MSSKLKEIYLHLEKNKGSDKFVLDKEIFLEKINSFLSPDSTIITVEINDIPLIKRIYTNLSKKCKIIIYLKDKKEALKARNTLDEKEIIVINKTFEKNDVKSNIADFVIGNNVLKQKGKNGDYIKEINRVLKSRGNFIFFELVNAEKNGIEKNYNKRVKESPIFYSICAIQNKLNHIKNGEYALEIFNADKKKAANNKIKSLKELSIFLKEKTSYHEMLSSDLTFVLSGIKKS